MIIKRISNLFRIIRDLNKRYKSRSILVFFQYLVFRKKFNVGYGDFISLGYLDMSEEQKNSLLFMPEYLTYCFQINPYSQLKVLRDKRTVILRLPQYLGRACMIEDFKDEANFMELTKILTSIYAKKNFHAAGIGTRVFRNLNTEDYRRKAYEICKNENLTIIEAFIEQHSVLSSIYPHVVNTIRIHTIRGKEGIRIVLLPELNLASGGEKDSIHSKKDRYSIFIDPQSGRLWEKAYRINNLYITTYEETFHCDTGTVFKDITIPYWEEVKTMVIDAASYITELAYIGWDVAITPKGPVIIEGNAISGTLGSYQIKRSFINGGYGVKKEYKEIFALAHQDTGRNE